MFTFGFAQLTSKNINAITKRVKSLREVGTEYNLRVFQIQFGGGEDYEFSLPHFIDDRIMNAEGFREERRIKPPDFVPQNSFDMTFSEAAAYAPFLTENNKTGSCR